MSIAASIYDAPIVRESNIADMHYMVVIKYNGQTYTGYADLHPDDIDFFSKKVGKNIALSRARIKAMKEALKKEEHDYKIRLDFFNTYIKCGAVRAEKALKRMKDRCKTLRAAIKLEEHNLDKYLEGQNRAMQTLKRMRDKANTN